MTDRKPRVLATRHFPPDVEARLAAHFDARLNPEDKLHDGPALVKAAEGFDVGREMPRGEYARFAIGHGQNSPCAALTQAMFLEIRGYGYYAEAPGYKA